MKYQNKLHVRLSSSKRDSEHCTLEILATILKEKIHLHHLDNKGVLERGVNSARPLLSHPAQPTDNL